MQDYDRWTEYAPMVVRVEAAAEEGGPEIRSAPRR